jgi:hypothetical protein
MKDGVILKLPKTKGYPTIIVELEKERYGKDERMLAEVAKVNNRLATSLKEIKTTNNALIRTTREMTHIFYQPFVRHMQTLFQQIDDILRGAPNLSINKKLEQLLAICTLIQTK